MDLERAPDAVRELKQAENELRSIRTQAMSLATVRPPASDQVSIDAARALCSVAVGGPRSFVDALDEGMRQLAVMISNLEADLADYGRADESGKSVLGRVDPT